MFRDEFDSVEEAVKFFNEDLEEGDKFYVGESVELHTSQFVDVDSLIERMWDNAECEVGEVADDYLKNIPQAEQDELTNLIAEWFDKKGYKPTFFKVDNIQTFVAHK